jgi:integrase
MTLHHFIEAAPSLKYKAALSVAYGAGLRVSEVAHLKVPDIDSGRMTLRVEHGKGQRERYVMLSLREWWHAARPPVWLFPGQNPINPVTERQINRAMQAAAKAAGIQRWLDELLFDPIQTIESLAVREHRKAISLCSGLSISWSGKRNFAG